MHPGDLLLIVAIVTDVDDHAGAVGPVGALGGEHGSLDDREGLLVAGDEDAYDVLPPEGRLLPLHTGRRDKVMCRDGVACACSRHMHYGVVGARAEVLPQGSSPCASLADLSSVAVAVLCEEARAAEMDADLEAVWTLSLGCWGWGLGTDP